MLPPYSMDSERSKPLLRDGDLWTAEDTLNTFTGADKNWCCQSVTVTSTVSSGTLPHVTLLNMLTVIRLCRFTRLLPSAVWQLNDLKVFSAVQNNLTGESDFFQTLSKCTSTNKHSDFWFFCRTTDRIKCWHVRAFFVNTWHIISRLHVNDLSLTGVTARMPSQRPLFMTVFQHRKAWNNWIFLKRHRLIFFTIFWYFKGLRSID